MRGVLQLLCNDAMNMRFASLLLMQIGLSIFSATSCAEEPSYKFTTGWYSTQGANQSYSHGVDLNLRRSIQDSNTWMAWYQSPEQGLKQPRLGWDSSLPIRNIRIQPSLQAALLTGEDSSQLAIWTRPRRFGGAPPFTFSRRPQPHLQPRQSLALLRSCC